MKFKILENTLSQWSTVLCQLKQNWAMFGQRKGKVDICGETEFQVRYVGKAETFVAAEKGCTHDLVQKIWDNSEDEYLMKRINVSISAAGVTITDPDNKQFVQKIDIKDISHCCAEKPPHDRVFTWISINKKLRKLECHAVICPSKDKAQMMAILLHRAFHVAYADWKTKKEQKSRRRQKSSLSNDSGVHNGNSSHSSFDDGASTSSAGSSEAFTPQTNKHMIINAYAEDTDSVDGYTSAMFSQMNVVEENEISFTENDITVKPNTQQQVSTWT